MIEKLFVKRVARKMLKTYNRILAQNPDLSRQAAYRSTLLQTNGVDPEQVDKVLSQAEDSVDLWTTNTSERLGLRQVVHFVVISQHREAGNVGTEVSFRDIVYSMIPKDA